jgi:uncharacterized membrane protein YhaH (DUF805 family)
MGLQDAVRSGLSKFFVFSGRASRSEFWLYTTFLFILDVALIAASSFVYSSFPVHPVAMAIGYWLIHGAFVISSWAASVRRLHDRSRSGWHMLWMFLPFAGGIVLLLWWCKKGVSGPNRYGSDPLEARA